MALLLCLCFISLAITTSNISLALVCMTPQMDATMQESHFNSSKYYEYSEADVMRRLKRAINDEAEYEKVRQQLLENERQNSTVPSRQTTKCDKARNAKRWAEIELRYGLSVDKEELNRLSSVTQQKCNAEKYLNWTSTEKGTYFFIFFD